MTGGYEEDLAMYEEAGGSKKKPLDEKVLLRPISEIGLPRDPVTVSPDTPVGQVIETLARERIGAVLVVEEGKLVGIFGERDVILRALVFGKRLERPVHEFMTPDPQTLTTHDSIALALSRMVRGGYRHIPLVGEDRGPRGMLRMRDVMRYVASFFAADVLNLPPHSEHRPPDHTVDGG